MIIEFILDLLLDLLTFIFSPVSIPALPAEVSDIFEQFKDVLIGGVGFVGVFVDLEVLRALIPVVLAIANFDKIWPLIMFVLRKIPFLGIE